MQLIKDMKAVPVIMDYKEHDYTVAAISHVPHLIAAGLTRTVKTNDDDEKHMHLLAAGGFRDTTRIAASSPEMWSQICNSNKDSICTFLDKFIEEMHNIRDNISNDTPEETSEFIENLFKEMGSSAKLPPVTLWFKGFLDKAMIYWPIPTVAIAAIVGAVLFYINTPRGRYNFHYFKYTMPIFGNLIFLLDFSRLIQALELNISNGMRIQDALDVSKNITNNQVMLAIIETSMNNMLAGNSWIQPFEDSGLCSSMHTEMLKIGMQTDLPEMLKKLNEYMNMDIKNTIDKVTAIMPQVVYSIVGVVLIFFVVVVLVPVIQVYMGGFMFESM